MRREIKLNLIIISLISLVLYYHVREGSKLNSFHSKSFPSSSFFFFVSKGSITLLLNSTNTYHLSFFSFNFFLFLLVILSSLSISVYINSFFFLLYASTLIAVISTFLSYYMYWKYYVNKFFTTTEHNFAHYFAINK